VFMRGCVFVKVSNVVLKVRIVSSKHLHMSDWILQLLLYQGVMVGGRTGQFSLPVGLMFKPCNVFVSMQTLDFIFD